MKVLLGLFIFCLALTLKATVLPQEEDVVLDSLSCLTDSLIEVADSIEDRLLREGEVTIELADELIVPASQQSAYDFIGYRFNHIHLNGDDWADLKEKLNATANECFSIVHIGDSHIQPDITTGELRRRLQSVYGNAGRGLITPFKLASTNEPRDYRFTLDCKASGTRLLKLPWSQPMGFTGISVAPEATVYNLKVENLNETDNTFRFVRIYSSVPIEIDEVKSTDGWIPFTLDCDPVEGYTDLFLDREVATVELLINSKRNAVIHGVYLGTEQPGIFYHAIGNNGATYSSYNMVDRFGEGISTLYPDLVIISLGTNEAYNRVSPEVFIADIDRMLKRIGKESPETKILLTTPKECQRRKRVRRRTTYSVVEGCNELRKAILDYGRDNNVAVYDWFEVAGGTKASDKWLKAGLLSKDRVHNTAEGYRLCADLFYDALMEAFAAK